MTKRSLVSRLKSVFIRPGRKPTAVRRGPLAGVILDLDPSSQSQVIWGLHERELHPWLRRYTPGIRTLIDVGAETGAYTLFGLLRTSAERVVGFEPSAESRARLVTNLAANKVADDDPRLTLSTAFVAATSGPAAVTLDEYADAPGPVLVKIDIDGGEADALAGAGRLLARPDVRLIIETHSVELEQHCLEVLRAAGLTARVVPNAWWRVVLPETRPIPHNRWLVAHREPAPA